MEDERTASSSTAIVSDAVKTIRLLVVMVLQEVLKTVKMGGYESRLIGSGLSRGVQNRPAHRRHGPV